MINAEKIRERMRASEGKNMADIHACVICGRDLEPGRQHVNTCGASHFRVLCQLQRGERLEAE